MPREQTIHLSIGTRFGRLVVSGDLVRIGRQKVIGYPCRCDCGETKDVRSSHLVAGLVKSCGCLNRDARPFANRKHGECKSSLFTRWCGMIERCENPKQVGYKHYGGKGIKVCDEWRSSF